MSNSYTRKKSQQKQKEHALSQLYRFASDASKGKSFNSLQFGYNLGRLQEMVEPDVVGAQKRWWSPIEPLVQNHNWLELMHFIKTTLKTQTQVEFNNVFLRQKGVSYKRSYTNV